MKRGTCVTCAFYHMVNHECRYNPPTIMRIDGEYKSRWPKVDNNDWCSHWYGAIMKSGERKHYARQINDGDVTFLESEQEQTTGARGEPG